MNDSAGVKIGKRRNPNRPKRELFAQLYAKHHNATLAAIEAGYIVKNAGVQGYRLVHNKELQKRIEAYGQLGLDTLAILTQSNNHIAAEKAAEALLDRAYGKAKNNDADNRGKVPNIVISFNKIDTSGKVVEGTAITSGGTPSATVSE